ncbi:aminoacyl-tRNA hydrolase [Candidatus Omnitrophota bacterium]
MKLIVGLGNPGLGYANTRHNLGARAVKAIAKEYKARFKLERSLKSRIAKIDIASQECLLAIPTTYMNLSGRAIGSLLNSKNISIKDLLVIYDDLDLELGVMRFRKGGSAGGHKGVSSIIGAINTREFNRLRLGIGKCLNKDVTKDYVLSNFCRDEIRTVDALIKRVIEGSAVWTRLGIDRAMNDYNQGGKK